MPDVTVLRRDLGAFAAECGRPLTPWQLDALQLRVRTTVIVGSRQSGKSRSLSVLALWTAFRKRDQHVLLISSGEDAAKRLVTEVRHVIRDTPLLHTSVVDEMSDLITLDNGSTIRSVPASERQIRGWSVDLLIIDEAALVSDDVMISAALPTVAARENAHIVMASSAVSAYGSFYDHAVIGDSGTSEHIRTYRWALADATWISPSAIASARDSMSDLRFRAEYLGEFASGQDALLTRQAIDNVLTDRTLWSLDALVGPARVMGGCDWGGTHDRSTCVGIARVPGDESVFAVVCAQRWQAGYPGPDVVKEIAAAPALFQVLTTEVNGLGLPLSQLLVRAIQARRPESGGGRSGAVRIIDANAPWPSPHRTPGKYKSPEKPRPRAFTTKQVLHTTTSASKAAMFGALRILVEKQQLLIPRAAEELIRELQLLRVDLSPSGTEKIEAHVGHDDLAMGLALSLGPHRIAGNEWRTHIARLSEQKSPTPWEAYNEDDPGVYQSIAGREIAGLTLPVPTAKPLNRERVGNYVINRSKEPR
jgi:Terminase large subunit, T4likevirus-type, N-terminal